MLLIQGLALFVHFYFKLKGSVLGCLKAGSYSLVSGPSVSDCRLKRAWGKDFLCVVACPW